MNNKLFSNKNIHKLTNILVAFLLVLTVFVPNYFCDIFADEEPKTPVSYRYPIYRDTTKNTNYEIAASGISRWETGNCSNYTVVSSSTTDWSAGWYVVNSSVTVSDRISCSGAVNLILLDGYTLTASNGITCSGENNSLTIYAQTSGSGTLVSSAAGEYNAGIGGEYGQSGDNITINGGIINVTGGEFSAGIGAGFLGRCGTNITINDGNVTAFGGDYGGGAGIGGGNNNSSGTFIVINGGTVTAKGSRVAAGIGGGGCVGNTGGWGSDITINGGNVIAEGGKDGGAGIGGGTHAEKDAFGSFGSNITITGGVIYAKGGEGSSGNRNGGYAAGAGIGGGGYAHNGNGGGASNITITGGYVTAIGGTDGLAIGGGFSKIKDACGTSSNISVSVSTNCVVFVGDSLDETSGSIITNSNILNRCLWTRMGINLPTKNSDLTYDGNVQVGVTDPSSSSHYTLTDNKKKSAGAYSAIASLEDDDIYTWITSSSTASTEDQSIDWSISKKDLSITGLVVSNKTHDGSKNASIQSGIIKGILKSDVENMTIDIDAQFADANKGNNKSVSISYTIGGDASSNYNKPVNSTTTANIS